MCHGRNFLWPLFEFYFLCENHPRPHDSLHMCPLKRAQDAVAFIKCILINSWTSEEKKNKNRKTTVPEQWTVPIHPSSGWLRANSTGSIHLHAFQKQEVFCNWSNVHARVSVCAGRTSQKPSHMAFTLRVDQLCVYVLGSRQPSRPAEITALSPPLLLRL